MQLAAVTNVAVRRSEEHVFFLTAALALLAIILIGFGHSYFLAGIFLARLPSMLVHVHAALFVGWILLFAAQIALVATGHVRWHRRLGSIMAIWALLMLLVGPPTVVMALRRPHSGVGGIEFFGNLAQLLVFGILIGTALLRRRDSATHKRLMLLGTATLMLPALARWPFGLPTPALLAVYLLVPLALLVWDRATLHRIHRATLLGLTLIVLLVASTLIVSATPVWIEFAHWVQT